ncbi:hypothetical protein K438DRAFT_2001072 [Mycena galopus ATCC 62051]|nr:hypothetical protein K438DRAFT_2001072 [Mycena galopus ATCC 62051]
MRTEAHIHLPPARLLQPHLLPLSRNLPVSRHSTSPTRLRTRQAREQLSRMSHHRAGLNDAEAVRDTHVAREVTLRPWERPPG